MSENFRISQDLSLTASLTITASVGFVSDVSHPDRYLVVQNHRGWDIVGGHVEKAETPEEAFAREVREESGCSLTPEPLLCAILISQSVPGTAIAVFRGFCHVADFTPTEEILARTFLTQEELLAQYFGDVEMLTELLQICTEKGE